MPRGSLNLILIIFISRSYPLFLGAIICHHLWVMSTTASRKMRLGLIFPSSLVLYEKLWRVNLAGWTVINFRIFHRSSFFSTLCRIEGKNSKVEENCQFCIVQWSWKNFPIILISSRPCISWQIGWLGNWENGLKLFLLLLLSISSIFAAADIAPLFVG